MRLKRCRVRILTLILIIGLFTTLLFSLNSTAQQDSITFKEFISDYDEPTQQFISYDEGTEPIIEDAIADIEHYEFDDNKITKIWFESEDDQLYSKYLTLIGEEAYRKYKVGEEVTVKIHIYADAWGHENYSASYSDLDHITILEEDEEKHGIDILGFHFEFPEQVNFLDNNYGRINKTKAAINTQIANCIKNLP